MTPADLAVLLRSVTAVRGEHRLDTAALYRRRSAVERPNCNPKNGDYVRPTWHPSGRQKVSANPASWPAWLAEALAAADGIARPRWPALASSICAWRRRRGRDRGNIVTAGAGWLALRPARRAEDQPRVRLSQPHRSDSIGSTPLGRGRRRPGPAAVHPGAPRRSASTTSRPRRPDRPLREFTDRRRQRTTCSRGRLRRFYISDIAAPGAGQGPRRARCLPDDERREDLPLNRRRPDVHPPSRPRCTSAAPDFDVTHEDSMHQRAGRPQAIAKPRDRQHL